jgi:hypothetical protein
LERVSVLCTGGLVCGKAKTDANGEFVIAGLSPGSFSVRVNHVGFYPWEQSGYKVRAGLEPNWSIDVERCPRANCDPRLRPKKPPAICE